MVVDILIFGATGFCGRHAARYILEHSDRPKYTVGIAAWSRSKLDSIGLPIDDSVQLFDVDILDEQAVESAVRQAKVVLNCVGPYWHYGTPVVRACARNGVHYVDITGETAWILDMIQKYDWLATKTQSIIVPSCGVDSIPADVVAHLASKTLGHAPLGSSTTAATLLGGVPGGTIASFLSNFEDVPPNQLDMASADWSLSPVLGAPSPPSRLVYYLDGGIVGTISVMSRINRAFVQRTAGLLERARRETLRGREADPACYGPSFTYTEFMPTGGVVSALLFSLSLTMVSAAFVYISPLRWLFKRLATKPGSGPADHKLEKGYLKYVNVTVSDEPVPRYAKTIIRCCGDPGTLLTAAMVGESALSLLLDKPLPHAVGGGVLTPMFVFGDNLIHRLEANNRFEITSRIVANPGDDIEESRKTR